MGLGWILQIVLIFTGFVEPMMFLVGILFAVAWWYGIRTGIRIDREAAQREREQAEWEAAHGTPRRRNHVDLIPKPHQPHWSSREH